MTNIITGRFLATLFSVFAVWSSATMAADKISEAEKAISSRLEESIPGLKVQSVKPSVVDGFFEVVTNNPDMIYATGDGEYFFVGDLYQVSQKGGLSNVTERTRSQQRVDRLAAVDPEDMITFAPDGDTKAEIYVFTDIDCPYCRKLHKDVPRLNELGVKVNYLAYPRSGPNTPSFRKYVSVWCSDDPQAAMTQAKAGESIPQASCENPVLEQFRLGGELGVTGTPAIVLGDGQMVRGYVPADKLAKGLGLL